MWFVFYVLGRGCIKSVYRLVPYTYMSSISYFYNKNRQPEYMQPIPYAVLQTHVEANANYLSFSYSILVFSIRGIDF